MQKIAVVLSLLGVAFIATLTLGAQSGGDPDYTPTRVNKMIELLEAGQPVYDLSVTGAGFEDGVRLAKTHNDLIQYQMEHGPFDPNRLREFMQGLVEGGPTKSGHRTPTVIVTLPILGLDEASIRVNHWVIEQVLSSGVHGLMLCHARTPEAVKAFVGAARYPFDRPDLDDEVIPEGLRGSGSQGFAAQIWGISGTEYLERADPWPMNPDGELILSLKLEDKYALENVEEIATIPGIGWAEWGPGDQAMSLMGLPYLQRGGSQGRSTSDTAATGGLPPIGEPILQAARERIFNALKANQIAILHSSSVNNVEELIEWGIMVTHGTSEELSTRGRRLTDRQMPY